MVVAAQSTGFRFRPGELESNNPEMESILHENQARFLAECLEWLWEGCEDFCLAVNLTVVYDSKKTKKQETRGPDFFVVRNVEWRIRKSWMVKLEKNRYPDFILELLSPSNPENDKNTKKTLYQDEFKTPEYFWFDSNAEKPLEDRELAGFRLVNGVYQPIQPNARGHLWSQSLDLFLGKDDKWLRFFDRQGDLVPHPREDARHERRQRERVEAIAEQERQQREQVEAIAERERQQREQAEAERNALLEKLERIRAAGIDPDAF